MQNVQAFSQSDSLETFQHLIFILRSIHDYDPVESPTAVEVVTRHVHQAYRRAPPMRPRIPEETVAVKMPSPRQAREDKNGRNESTSATDALSRCIRRKLLQSVPIAKRNATNRAAMTEVFVSFAPE